MGREKYIPPRQLCKDGLEDAYDFVQRLLSKASDRIGRRSCQCIMEHKYFDGIDFKRLRDKLVSAPYVPKICHRRDFSHFDVDDDDNSVSSVGEDGCITLDF